jgi:hypothetical protein
VSPIRKKRRGRTQYQSAGAFAQTRLDKYVASVASGSIPTFPSGYGSGSYGGGTGGGGGGIDPFPHIHLQAASTTIGAGGEVDLSTVVHNRGSCWDVTDKADGYIYITEPGLYVFFASFRFTLSSSSGTPQSILWVYDDSMASTYGIYLTADQKASGQLNWSGVATGSHYFATTGTINIDMFTLIDSLHSDLENSNLSIVRLSG